MDGFEKQKELKRLMMERKKQMGMKVQKKVVKKRRKIMKGTALSGETSQTNESQQYIVPPPPPPGTTTGEEGAGFQYSRDPISLGLPVDFFEYYNEPPMIKGEVEKYSNRLHEELHKDIKKKQVGKTIVKKAVPALHHGGGDYSSQKKKSRKKKKEEERNLAKSFLALGEDMTFLDDEDNSSSAGQKGKKLVDIEEEMAISEDEEEINKQISLYSKIEEMKKRKKEAFGKGEKDDNIEKKEDVLEKKKRTGRKRKRDVDPSVLEGGLMEFSRKRKKKKRKRK